MKKKVANWTKGVYCIENIANGKKYVGHSRYMGKRFNQHKGLLANGKHHNTHLQRAWNKYGCDNFRFSVLEIIDDDIEVKEQQWMDRLMVTDDRFGYNIAPKANKSAQSEETKLKISKTKTGVPMTEETKKKLSKAKKGKPLKFTDEGRKRHRQALKNRKDWNHSSETKEKISKNRKGKPAWNKGLKMSESQKESIRQARLAKPNPRCPVTGQFLKGKLIDHKG